MINVKEINAKLSSQQLKRTRKQGEKKRNGRNEYQNEKILRYSK